MAVTESLSEAMSDLALISLDERADSEWLIEIDVLLKQGKASSKEAIIMCGRSLDICASLTVGQDQQEGQQGRT